MLLLGHVAIIYKRLTNFQHSYWTKRDKLSSEHDLIIDPESPREPNLFLTWKSGLSQIAGNEITEQSSKTTEVSTSDQAE